MATGISLLITVSHSIKLNCIRFVWEWFSWKKKKKWRNFFKRKRQAISSRLLLITPSCCLSNCGSYFCKPPTWEPWWPRKYGGLFKRQRGREMWCTATSIYFSALELTITTVTGAAASFRWIEIVFHLWVFCSRWTKGRLCEVYESE